VSASAAFQEGALLEQRVIFREKESITDMLPALLVDPWPFQRFLAAMAHRQLVHKPGEVALNVIELLLPYGEPDLQYSANRTGLLQARFGETAVPHLISALQESHPRRIEASLHALSILGPFGDPARPFVLPYLKSRHHDVQLQAFIALSAMGNPDIATTIAMDEIVGSHRESSATKRGALALMAKRRPPEGEILGISTSSLMKTLMGFQESELPAAVVSCVTELRLSGMCGDMIRALQVVKDPHWKLKEAVIRWVRRSGPSLQEHLPGLSVLATKSFFRDTGLQQALACVVDPEAAVRTMLGDEERQARLRYGHPEYHRCIRRTAELLEDVGAHGVQAVPLLLGNLAARKKTVSDWRADLAQAEMQALASILAGTGAPVPELERAMKNEIVHIVPACLALARIGHRRQDLCALLGEYMERGPLGLDDLTAAFGALHAQTGSCPQPN